MSDKKSKKHIIEKLSKKKNENEKHHINLRHILNKDKEEKAKLGIPTAINLKLDNLKESQDFQKKVDAPSSNMVARQTSNTSNSMSAVWKQYISILINNGKCFFEEISKPKDKLCDLLKQQIKVTQNMLNIINKTDEHTFQDFVAFVDVQFPEKSLLLQSFSNFEQRSEFTPKDDDLGQQISVRDKNGPVFESLRREASDLFKFDEPPVPHHRDSLVSRWRQVDNNNFSILNNEFKEFAHMAPSVYGNKGRQLLNNSNEFGDPQHSIYKSSLQSAKHSGHIFDFHQQNKPNKY